MRVREMDDKIAQVALPYRTHAYVCPPELPRPNTVGSPDIVAHGRRRESTGAGAESEPAWWKAVFDVMFSSMAVSELHGVVAELVVFQSIVLVYAQRYGRRWISQYSCRSDMFFRLPSWDVLSCVQWVSFPVDVQCSPVSSKNLHVMDIYVVSASLFGSPAIRTTMNAMGARLRAKGASSLSRCFLRLAKKWSPIPSALGAKPLWRHS